jgi:plastocyanin
MKAIHIAALAAAVWASQVGAQTLTDVKAEPAQVKVGETVKATANFEVKNNAINCGIRFNWGDGTNNEDKVNQAQDVPKIMTHQYAQPGTYTIVAEPRQTGSSLKCLGKNKTVVVTVAAAAVAAAPAPAPVASAAKPMAAAAPAAASVCPAGWKLGKAGVNKKTKAFTCSAAANTALPEAKVACPGDLTYFENAKKGQLGCRK